MKLDKAKDGIRPNYGREAQLLTESYVHHLVSVACNCRHLRWPNKMLDSQIQCIVSSSGLIHHLFVYVSFCYSLGVFSYRTQDRQRRGAQGEDFDYPPMDPGCFSPTAHPPPWLGPPPPYEVAIKTTCSSTNMRRAYSDTQLATEPLFGRSREISFEV